MINAKQLFKTFLNYLKENNLNFETFLILVRCTESLASNGLKHETVPPQAIFSKFA